MPATLLKAIFSAALLGAEAAAVNSGGWPFSSLWPKKDSKEVTTLKGAEELTHVAQTLKSVEQGHPASNESAQVSKPSNASVIAGKGSSNASVIAHKSSKLIMRKRALLASATDAMKHYAIALADVDAGLKEQRQAAKVEDKANTRMEEELAKLQVKKQEMVKAATENMEVSPLDASYGASRDKLAAAQARVDAEEERVNKTSTRSSSVGKDKQEAASRVASALEEKAKAEEEVRAALAAAGKLLARINEARNQHKSNVDALEGYAVVLERQGAALKAAVSDANNASDASNASAAPMAKHSDTHAKKGQAAKTGQAKGASHAKGASAAPTAEHSDASAKKDQAASKQGSRDKHTTKHSDAHAKKDSHGKRASSKSAPATSASHAKSASAAPAAKHSDTHAKKGATKVGKVWHLLR